MAYKLEFSGLQPVSFNGKDCEPSKPNAEQRLRLGRIKFDTDADEQNAVKVLASCFPNDGEFVEQFLLSRATPIEMSKLANYLMAGAEGIGLTEKVIEEKISAVKDSSDE